MMQNNGQPGSPEGRPDSQTSRGFNMSPPPPPSQMPVKTDEPVQDDIASNYEYIPTPFNPPRIDRCRVDNFVMIGIEVLMFIFGVAALATPITYYSAPNISIYVNCLTVMGASKTGTHQVNSNGDIFCGAFIAKSDGFAALLIMSVLFGVLGFILALMPVICGRVLCCRYFVQVLILICWFFVMLAVILSAQMRNESLCQSTSLKSIGFSYGPAFGLTVTLFVLHTLVLIFLVVWHIKYPAKLRYQ